MNSKANSHSQEGGWYGGAAIIAPVLCLRQFDDALGVQRKAAFGAEFHADVAALAPRARDLEPPLLAAVEPPLVITYDEINQGLASLSEAVEAVSKAI